MAKTPRVVIVGTAAIAALALAAPPASAQTTTIRSGAAGAPAYSGNVQAQLLGNATITSSIGNGTCNQSTMTGSIQSNGTGLTIGSANFNNNGGDCTGTVGSRITAVALPWSGGSVTHDAAHTGGRDAAVVIANFRVSARVNLFGGITCVFGGSLTASAYNPDNPARGDTSVAQAQVGVQNAAVTKISQGSSWLCPGSARVTANYALLGESAAGSGTYDQSLYVTE